MTLFWTNPNYLYLLPPIMSSASSSSAGSPEPDLKRKRPVEKDDASDASDAESDAPALSHAEKRRQKKLEKKQKEGKLPAAKKRKLDDGTATEARDANGKTLRQNSVWVGNMLFKTTQEDLRTFFNECGEITRINMPMKPGVSGGVSRLENRGHVPCISFPKLSPLILISQICLRRFRVPRS